MKTIEEYWNGIDLEEGWKSLIQRGMSAFTCSYWIDNYNGKQIGVQGCRCEQGKILEDKLHTKIIQHLTNTVPPTHNIREYWDGTNLLDGWKRLMEGPCYVGGYVCVSVIVEGINVFGEISASGPDNETEEVIETLQRRIVYCLTNNTGDYWGIK